MEDMCVMFVLFYLCESKIQDKDKHFECKEKTQDIKSIYILGNWFDEIENLW